MDQKFVFVQRLRLMINHQCGGAGFSGKPLQHERKFVFGYPQFWDRIEKPGIFQMKLTWWDWFWDIWKCGIPYQRSAEELWQHATQQKTRSSFNFQPLWKMMEWKSVGMMTFPTEWKNNPVMFQSPPTSHDLGIRTIFVQRGMARFTLYPEYCWTRTPYRMC